MKISEIGVYEWAGVLIVLALAYFVAGGIGIGVVVLAWAASRLVKVVIARMGR